jgi:archaellum biogenesis protein FlaJ (TadC family)
MERMVVFMTKLKKYLTDEDNREIFISLIGSITFIMFLILVTVILFCDGHWKLGTLSSGWVLLRAIDMWIAVDTIMDELEAMKE